MTPERLQDIRTAALQSLSNPVKDNRGWIHADCPHCGKPAKEKKFAYNPNKGKYGSSKCLSCGEKANAYKLAEMAGLLPEYNSERTERKPRKKPVKPVQIKAEQPKPRKVYRREPDFITRHPETGQVCYGIYRFENKDGSKATPPAILKDGKWLSGLDGYKGEKFYNGLYEARNAERVFIAEGEKKARQLNDILPSGLAAVSVMGGADGMRNREQIEANAPFLKGKAVYILPDIDPEKPPPKQSFTGQRAALALLSELRKHGVKAHIIDPVEIAGGMTGYDKFDIGDAVEMHGPALVEPLFNAVLSVSDETDAAFSARWMTTAADGFREFESQYITDTLFPEQITRAFLLSAQGTGKTYFAKEMVKTAKDKGRRVLVISHRTSLLTQAAENFDIDFYENVPFQIGGKYYPASMAITPESLHKLDWKEYQNALVIVDEFDQTAEQLFGSTCSEHRAGIIGTLKKLLETAPQVLCISADMTPAVEKTFRELGFTPEQKFRNVYKPATRTGTRYLKPFALVRDALAEIKAGRRVAIACESKSMAKRLFKKAERDFPGKSFLIVTSDNSGSEQVKEILHNPEKMKAFDAVFFSPSIFSGVDFNIDHAETVYLIAAGKSQKASDLMQAISRFRKARRVRYYVPDPTLNPKRKIRETDPNKIFQKYIDREFQADPDHDFKGLSTPTLDPDGGRVLSHEWEPLVRIAAEFEAEKNASLNDLRNEFESLFMQRGGQIFTTDATDAPEIKAELAEIKQELDDQERAEIIAADDLTETEYKKLKNKSFKTPDEITEMKRFQYTRANGGADELETAVQESAETFVNHADRWTDVFKLPGELLKQDMKTRSGFLPDHKYRYEQQRTRREVLELTRLLDGGEIDAPMKEGLKEYLTENKARLNAYLFEITPAMLKNPVLFVRSFCQTIGLKLEKHGRSDNRRYRLNRDQLEYMTRLLARRMAHNENERGKWDTSFLNIQKIKPELSPTPAGENCNLFQGVA